MRNYKNYEVWTESHELVLFLYSHIVPILPGNEIYGLTDQMKRAAYSIPFNIAEGCGRNSDRDFTHFLDISMGSVHELEYSILLINDLHYINQEHFKILNKRINVIKAMLIKLIKSIRESKSKSSHHH
jgi:four helix bundle protein